MKRVFLFLLAMILTASITQAQVVLVGSESFDGGTHTFTSTPGSAWMTDTIYQADGTKAIWGMVPSLAGDSIILTTPVYDCTSYGYVTMRFSHICKVSPMDQVQVQYRLNVAGAGGAWQDIPASAYVGSAANYATSGFNAASYAIWNANDSLALPTNSWWKEEIFDLSNQVSYDQVQFRFVLRKGNVPGTNISYGWLIDKFELTASVHELKAPVVEFVSSFTDTVLFTGPYLIQAKVAKRTVVDLNTPNLIYTASHPVAGTVTDTLVMTAYQGDSLWQATIPQYIFGSTINYSVRGEDSVGNYATATDGFISKHPIGGTQNDSVLIGTPNGGIYNCAFPWCTMGDGFNWSLALYKSSDIGNTSTIKTLSGLAYHNTYTYYHVRYNVKCYMKETTDNAIASSTYLDPIAAGATLVYSGNLTITPQWNEVKFDNIYNISSGKNLYVWWVDSSSANTCSQNSGTIYWDRFTTNYNSIAYNGNHFTGCSGSSTNTVSQNSPVTKFYFGAPITDSNSVAMYRIENPTSTGTMANQVQPVLVTFKNKGFADMKSAVFGWSLNGVLQDTIHWSGNLPDDFNDTITLGYYTQRASQFDTIQVWVNMPNGILDTNYFDDTLTVISYGCESQLSGSYTVGKGKDFETISDFVNIAKLCNPVGDISLEVESGTYVENWNLSSIGNIMGNYMLTITSEAHNADSVIVKPSSGVALTLGNNKNLTIKDITFDCSPIAAYTVQFTGACEDVIIRDCKILSSTTTTSSTSNAIYKASSTGILKRVSFINNYISGGYYGFYLYGGTGTAAFSQDLVVDSNIITDQYYYGTYFYYDHFKSCSYNKIYSRTANTSTTWYGLRSYYGEFDIANANSVIQRSTAITQPYGIYAYYTNDARYGSKPTTGALFTNNEVNLYTTSTYYGTYFCYSTINFYNNSILMRGSGAARGMYLGNYANSYYDIQGNNIVTLSSTGIPIYFTSSPVSAYYNFAFNNLYAPSNIAYVGSNISGLAAWRGYFPNDVNTISVNPTYVDNTKNLQLTNYAPFAIRRIPSVARDINDSLRAFTTAMGCYKGFDPRGVDAILNSITDLQSGIVVSQTDTVKVELLNGGNTTLTTATINWSINGVNQTPVTWTGSLTTEQSAMVTLGAITYVAKTNAVKAWISSIGNLTDEDKSNDTIETSSYACTAALAGTYTVGTATSDFPTLEEAMESLTYCGLSGDVTMKFASGIYDALNLSDLDFNYLVTFTSATGNASDVKFVSSANAMTLSNVSKMRFDHVTFDASSGNGAAVQLMGMITDVDFYACNMTASPTATTSTSAGVYYNNGSSTATTTLSNVKFIKNNISGGYYGMYLYYMGGANSNVTSGTCRVTIDDNNFTNFYCAGIYSYYYSRYKSISYNNFVSRVASTTQYAMYIAYYNVIDSGIVGNKILLQGTSTNYGLYCYYINSSSYAAYPALFANNEIRKLSGGSTNYGAYVYYPRIKMYNNSMLIKGTGTNYGIRHYSTSSSYSCDMRNNILATGSGYPIYCESSSYVTSAYVTTDYNNYYSTAGTIGYTGVAQTTLAALRSATGQDAHSISVVPSWIDSTINLDLNEYTPFLSPNMGNLPTDIIGHRRGNTTVMGAYSPTVNPGYDLKLKAVLGLPDVTELCVPDLADLDYVIVSTGEENYDFSVDTLFLRLQVSGPTIFDTTVVIFNSGLTLFEMDTIHVVQNLNLATTGIYEITAWLESAVDTLYDNDTIRITHIVGKVALPMDETFENGLPLTMRVADNNTVSEWTILYDSNATGTVIPATDNAMIAFDGSRGAMSRLFTRQLDLSGTSEPILDFWYWHDTAATISTMDYTDVRLTFDGGQTFTTLFSVRKNNGTDMGWTQYTYSLDSFVNQSCIILVFEAMRMSLPQFDGEQYIDRIKLTSNQDLSLESMFVPELTPCDYTGKELGIIMGSQTAQNINFEAYPTTLQVNITGDTVLSYNIPLNSGIIPGLDYDTLVIDNNFDFNPGTYYIYAKIMTSIDKVAANDVLRDTIIVNPSIDLVATQITGGNDNTNCIGIGSHVNQVVALENDGNMDMEDVILTLNVYDITGAKVQTIEDTLAGLFAINQTTTYTFAEVYDVPEGAMYNVEIVANPMCNASLTYTDVLTECVDQSDVEVTAFINPTDDETCSSVGENIKVKVRVSNNHPDEDIQGVVLNVVVSANNAQIASWTETLSDISSDSYIDFEFPQGFNVPEEADYTIVAYVNSVDTKSSNDTLSITKCTDLGVIDQDANAMFLGQNIPNPAKAQTVVNYQVPTEGTVVFTLTTVTGQVIYTTTQEVAAGRNSVEFNTENLAAGIYFYTMDFNGQRLTKKMTVRK